MADFEEEPQEAKKAKVDRTSRCTYESVDWSMCIFCQKKEVRRRKRAYVLSALILVKRL